uniref:Uncharacterized protein n=1 Tax=Fagus sylvatica TaxID=28930 RepID=A0A2N9GPE2_FAGSY
MARISAQWLGFWLEVDLGVAWLDHGSMARIAAQWLEARILKWSWLGIFSSVTRWLGSISAH